MGGGRPAVQAAAAVPEWGGPGPRQLWLRDHATWSSYQRAAVTPCHDAASSTWSWYQRAAVTPRDEVASSTWSWYQRAALTPCHEAASPLWAAACTDTCCVCCTGAEAVAADAEPPAPRSAPPASAVEASAIERRFVMLLMVISLTKLPRLRRSGGRRFHVNRDPEIPGQSADFKVIRRGASRST